MNIDFKNKKTGDIVRYLGVIEHLSDDNAEREGWNYLPRYEWCIQMYNKNKHRAYVISLLEFMNTYEPATKAVNDILNAFDTILSKEDEGNKENIHTLHSGESETDSSSAPEGVQE